MGQFAGTLFRMLLGWVQTAVSWLWNLATSADVSAWLQWLLDNWLTLVIILCMGGVLVDFVVYLIRWQPYRVWRRFLARVSGRTRREAEDAAQQPVMQRKWVFADGSTEVEEIPQDGIHSRPAMEALDVPIRPTRRALRYESPEQSYNQPVYPPQWRHSGQEEQGDAQ